MSTYAENPYFYSVVNSTSNPNNCVELNDTLERLRDIFFWGGWEVSEVFPYGLVRTPKNDPGFTLCTLGYLDAVFWRVTLSGNPTTTLVADAESFDGTSCCDLEDVNDPCYQHLRNVLAIRDVFLYPYAVGDNRAKHDLVLEAMIIEYAKQGVSVFLGETVENDSNEWITEVYTSNMCAPTIDIGSGLLTNFDGFSSFGFIAKSQPSNSVDNFVHIYVAANHDAILTTQPFAPWIRFFYKTTDWSEIEFTPAPDIILEPDFIFDDTYDPNDYTFPMLSVTGGHPMAIVEEKWVTEVTGVSISLTNDFICWCNPYTFILYPVTPGGGTVSIILGVLKLKNLEGEDLAFLNITRIGFFMGYSGGSFLQNRCAVLQSGIGSYAVKFESEGFGLLREVEPYTDPAWGPLVFNVLGVGSNTNFFDDQIVWAGDIAEIGEPWCGGNFISGADPTPIIGQLWDCVIPTRNLDGVEDYFVFDGQLFKYLQTSINLTTYPPTSLALRVLGDGWQFDPLLPFMVLGKLQAGFSPITVSPNPIIGSNITLSITLEEIDARGSIIYWWTNNDFRMVFPVQYLIWSEFDDLTKTIEIPVIQLNYTENTTMYFRHSTGIYNIFITYNN